MSDVSAIIADLVRAGVDPELIGRVASALAEREPVKIVDEQADRRRAKDRERKRLRNSAEICGDVRNSAETLPPSPFPLDPPSQTLPPIIPQTPSTIPAKKRGTRLSDEWVLPRAWGEWAVGQGFSESVIRSEAEQFRDYWIAKSGKDAAKLDWEATWRNWMRNCAKRQPSRGPPAGRERTMSDAIDDLQRRLSHEPEPGSTIEHIDGDYSTNVHLLAAPKGRQSR